MVLLFLAGCAFGVLEVHSSTDTWIGLMAGRAIMNEPEFPMTDSWSFTFEGQTWFNQNWLSHVYFWLLYDYLGEDAVVYGTWAIGVAIFVFALLASWYRSGSWLAATLAGGLVAIASRDWLSARPATVQFFMLSFLWMTLSALLSQGPKQRWWAVALLFPLFVAWPHAHGSFIFGYLLVGMILGWDATIRIARLKPWWIIAIGGFIAIICLRQVAVALGVDVSVPKVLAAAFAFAFAIVVARVWRFKPLISIPQVGVICGIIAVTVVLSVVLSPYGIHNLTHPFVVTESEIFRTVGEWIPPYREANYPPVKRFWIALGFAGAIPIVALLLLAADRISNATGEPRSGPSTTPAAQDAAEEPLAPRVRWETVLLDLATVALGLGMAIFARRFAPIFYILAAPALSAWIMRLGRSLSPWMRCRSRDAVVAGAWLLLVWTVYETSTRARKELYDDVGPGNWNLLARVTRLDQTPQEAIEFLRRNKLEANLFTEWTQAAVVRFGAPTVKIFIDGRSQQVFDERHYLRYMKLLGMPPGYEKIAARELEECGTNGVLLRRTPSAIQLIRLLDANPDWERIYSDRTTLLYARRGSSFHEEIYRRERAGDLWWPDLPECLASRGSLAARIWPTEPDRALRMWQSAIEAEPRMGLEYYHHVTQTMLETGRASELEAYLTDQKRKLDSGETAVPPSVADRLLSSINYCEGAIARYQSRQRRP